MEFSEIDELYKHLETDAGNYKYAHQIANLFQKLRDSKNEAGQAEAAEKAQWEIDCFSFRTQSGELKCMFSGTDENGQPWEYPSISKLSEKELEYIEDRLKNTSNPILKSRYAHILWESSRKHIKYAKLAVDSYLELVSFYERKDKEDPQAHNGPNVLNSVIEASCLAFKINYRIDDVRSEAARLVREFNFDSSSAFVMRVRLIRHMLEGKGRFPTACFTSFSEVCLDLGQRLFKGGRYHNAIDIFETGEKVDNKLSQKTHDWNRSIAESYEGLMNERDESDLAVTSFCQMSIEYYKKIKDEKKIRELEERYEHLKGRQQFQKFSQEIDLTEYRKKCKEIAEKICGEEAEKIISILIADKSLLPTFKDMKERADEISKETIFTHIAPVSITDQYGHTAEHFTTDDEKEYYRVLDQYMWEIQLGKQILINEIFIKSVKNGKLNLYSVMEFFEKRSWYGKNIKKSIPQGETTYNWLNLIAPSMNEYFSQMQAHFLEPAYSPNFVLAMDSLALKIEGLVRDICTFSGITTFFQTKDKQGRNIVREKDINWLLREEPIKDLFDEDDLLFFKFVLVEKAGINLRHKIAHCLIDYSDYNILYMHLLILVLLRLGRYDFVKPDVIVEEKVAE
jgi:hypothetical protein